MSWLQATKFWIGTHTHLAKDALHIYVALAVMFASALAFKWKLSSWKPWAVVLAAALAGEAWDILDRLIGGIRVRPGGHLHDVWNTMFWPSAILLLARYTKLFQR